MAVILHRRRLLVGLASMLAAPAIVRAENIMPVRALTLDPLVRGIRWQSWPHGTPQPDEFCVGSFNLEFGNKELRPLSYFMAEIERHRRFNPDLCWEAVR